MNNLIIGLIIFLGVHLSLRAVNLRAAIEAKIGKMGFKGVFSFLAITGLILIFMGYGQYRPEAEIVYDLGHAGKGITYILTFISIVLILSSFLGGFIKAKIVHPQLAAVKLWAFGHLLANGDNASIILFGSFLAWAVLSRIKMGKAVRENVKWGRGDEGAIAFGILIWCTIAFMLHPVLFGVKVFG